MSANTVVTITADYFFAGNEYTITTDITVIAPPPRLVPVITWSNPGDIVYGMALSTMQLNANAASPANPSGAIPGTFTYSPPLGTVLAAGSHQALSVTFLPTDTTTYASSSATVSLNVQQAPLTITANNQSTAYGAALPALSVSYSGFVNGDTSANLTTQPAVTTTATAGSPVGGYPITANGAADANYIINSLPGTLTVTPVPLTITANNQSKGYGAALPPLSASYSGFVNGDTPASLTTQPMVSTTATAGSPVGGYSITANGAADANYIINSLPGTLTVTPVPLTITANNQSKGYGAALPPLSASYSGFVNGDTPASLTTQPMVSTTATAGSPVGLYPITVSGATDANYLISSVAGVFAVTSVELTITANNQSTAFGAAIPALTVSYSGFVNGDTPASLTRLPWVTTTAVTGSPVGVYPITTGGATAANYIILYVAGTLTITAGIPADFSSASLNGNLLKMILSAGAGQNYALDRSPNLVDWTPLVTNTVAAGGTVNFSDTVGVDKSKSMFYRARLVP